MVLELGTKTIASKFCSGFLFEDFFYLLVGNFAYFPVNSRDEIFPFLRNIHNLLFLMFLIKSAHWLLNLSHSLNYANFSLPYLKHTRTFNKINDSLLVAETHALL